MEKEVNKKQKQKQNNLSQYMEETQEKQEKVKAAEKELEKYGKSLPEILSEKVSALAEKVSTMKEAKGLTTLEINELLRGANNKYLCNRRKYSSEELLFIFEEYRKAMIEINKKWKYPPSKENFCSFANISTASYNNWLQNGDEETQEIMQQIDDYIRENMLTSAQVGDLREITTMFRGKTSHGLVEASAPIEFVHHSDANLDNIKKLIDTINNGKSVKTLELEKDKDGVYRAKDK